MRIPMVLMGVVVVILMHSYLRAEPTKPATRSSVPQKTQTATPSQTSTAASQTPPKTLTSKPQNTTTTEQSCQPSLSPLQKLLSGVPLLGKAPPKGPPCTSCCVLCGSVQACGCAVDCNGDWIYECCCRLCC